MLCLSSVVNDRLVVLLLEAIVSSREKQNRSKNSSVSTVPHELHGKSSCGLHSCQLDIHSQESQIWQIQLMLIPLRKTFIFSAELVFGPIVQIIEVRR